MAWCRGRAFVFLPNLSLRRQGLNAPNKLRQRHNPWARQPKRAGNAAGAKLYTGGRWATGTESIIRRARLRAALVEVGQAPMRAPVVLPAPKAR